MKRLLPAATIALLTAGCVAQVSSRYPSLQPRAIESRSDSEAVAATATVAPDSALDAQLAGHAKTLADTDAGFTPAAAAAERAARAARGDSAGGERWITAQTALGKLDAFRAATSAALTDIEETAIARARDGKPDYPGVETLRARGEAQLDAEIRRIAEIQALAPGG